MECGVFKEVYIIFKNKINLNTVDSGTHAIEFKNVSLRVIGDHITIERVVEINESGTTITGEVFPINSIIKYKLIK